MRWAFFALATAVFAIATGSAMAQESDFDLADRNDDGKINRQEFMERETEVFFLLDVDKDGHLVVAEIKNVEEVRFKAADHDGDGMLSMDEFLDARSHDFDAADANKDGRLDDPEIAGAK